MISTMTALRILDCIFAAATMLVLLVIAGFPTEWLLALADLSLREVQWSAFAIVFAAAWLIHAVARSNRLPRSRRPVNRSGQKQRHARIALLHRAPVGRA